MELPTWFSRTIVWKRIADALKKMKGLKFKVQFVIKQNE